MSVWVFVVLCDTGIQAAAVDKYADMIKPIVGNGNKALNVNVPALEASFDRAFGIAQSSNGDIYFAAPDPNVVLKVEFNKLEGTSRVTIVAGTGTAGKGGEDILATASALNFPVSVTLIEDSNGKVTTMLIAEASNYRIRKVDMDTGKIKTIAGKLSGQSTDGTPATEFSFSGPYHAYYDKSSDDIFIVDYHKHQILRMFANNGTISTVVGKCTVPGELGDGGLAIDACLKNPYYLTMNKDGEWFIADTHNNRIRKVGLDGKIQTVAGGGEQIDDAPATQVFLNRPRYVHFTPSGELLVVDEYGQRVRKMDKNGFMRVIAGGGTTVPVPGVAITAKTASFRPSAAIYARDGSDDILISDHNGYIMRLSIAECDGVRADNGSVCSGHGSCVGIDQCQCNDGWSAEDCTVARCFGFTSGHPSICSAHGSCVAPDGCTCNDGWMGIDCSITHCFGITSNHPDVCSGNGQCIKHNKCKCDGGFRGHKCQRSP